MSDNIMTILVVEPMQEPYVWEIDGSLASMQDIVGGAIEGTYPFDDCVAIICNGDGKLKGLPPNRNLTDSSGIPYDTIHGTFFVVGLGKETFRSLTDEQIRHFQEVFRLPGRDTQKKDTQFKKKGNHTYER